MRRSLDWFKSWEGLLLVLLILSVVVNMMLTPYYLSVNNIVNLFVMLSIEKIIVALVMTMIIINGEIDLSVAFIMGLAAACWPSGVNAPVLSASAAAMLVGILAGAQRLLIAKVGLPSLAVTLAASSATVMPRGPCWKTAPWATSPTGSIAWGSSRCSVRCRWRSSSSSCSTSSR
ncbi:MAG: hypothetical protein R2854_06705 [Caldilineaceae bacterium]